jgi:hypothetical protein
MSAHKYRIGQHVSYRSHGRDWPPGVYVVLARLPQSDDGEFQYRIRHSRERHQLRAKESQLKPTPSRRN